MGLRKLIKKYQEKQAVEKARRKEIQTIKKEALHTARLKEVKVLATQQAQLERQQKFQRMKGGGRSGIMGAVAERVNIAAENLGYAKGGGMFGTMGRAPTTTAPQIQHPKVKRTKKKKRKKVKVIHTKVPQQSYQPQPHNVFATSIRRSF